MNHEPISVQEYIARNLLNYSNSDDWAKLRKIAGLTALRVDSQERFFLSNFWRGPMLYSLVRRIKPQRVLELGTGRGYGAFCMAQAMVDDGIDGKVVTVDRTPAEFAYDWPYENTTGEKLVAHASVAEFWPRHLPGELRDKVEFRCGDTASVHNLLESDSTRPELIFIDGDHSYVGVTLDYLSARAVAAPNSVFVFDDYSSRPGYGITRLLADEGTRMNSVNVIDMELTSEHDISVDHKMAVCNDDAEALSGIPAPPPTIRYRYLIARRWFRAKAISVAKLFKLR